MVALAFPTPCKPFFCSISASMPPNSCESKEVPPAVARLLFAFLNPLVQELPEATLTQYRNVSWLSDASIDRSGTSREPSTGTPEPCCHAGLGKKLLTPPPPPPKPRMLESSHGSSGI